MRQWRAVVEAALRGGGTGGGKVPRRSALAWRAVAVVVMSMLAIAPAARAAAASFCGGTALEWAQDLAHSATARLGDALDFGQPRASLDYSNDLFAMSLLRLAKRTGDVGLRDAGETIVGGFVAPDGAIKRVPAKGFRLDVMPAGIVLLDIYRRTGEAKYRAAAEELRRRLAELPRVAEGTFAWAPEQIWLDGLWMTEPFYARYAAEFAEPADFDDILRQYRAVVAHNRDPATGLYRHGWDARRAQFWADKETGMSASVWARAMGWFAMSLVDTLDAVPSEHPLRVYLVQVLNELAPVLLRFQDAQSGLWWNVVDAGDRGGNYTEASASAMYVYTLAKAVNRGYLSNEYAAAAVRGFGGLVRDKVVRDAAGRWSLTSIIRSAGLGPPPAEWPPGSPTPSVRDTVAGGRDGSFAYYVEQPITSDNLHGLGPFILAGVEVDGLLASTPGLPVGGGLKGCRFTR